MIYFVGNLFDSKMVKIGYAKNDVDERIRQLQTGCPFHLKVYVVMEGTIKHEQDLHKILSTHRRSGEWFSHAGHLRTILKALQAGKPMQDRLAKWLSGTQTHRRILWHTILQRNSEMHFIAKDLLDDSQRGDYIASCLWVLPGIDVMAKHPDNELSQRPGNEALRLVST